MNFKENVLLALNGLKSNKMRAFLTMLGIIIGISSVIMITTLGSIVKSGLGNLAEELGMSNIMEFYLNQKDDAPRGVSKSDFMTIEMIEQVREHFSDKIKYMVVSTSSGGGKITHNRVDYAFTLSGTTEDGAAVQNTEIVRGRFIERKDIDHTRNVCVIPNELADILYGSAKKAVGQTLRLDTQSGTVDFAVIGVYKFKQTSFGGVYTPNYYIHIPYTTSLRIEGADPLFAYFDFTAVDGVDAVALSKEILKYINERYYKNNDTVVIESYTMTEQLEEYNSYLVIVQLVLSLIAGISLLVGGIGVMNIMLVSVTERTREIGVRKALGAPNSAIRIQFIVESVIICFIGGAIGIILGILLGNIGGMILKQTAIPSVPAIIIAVTFSMAIGVFFGYYPANKAAKLDPIEALRYE